MSYIDGPTEMTPKVKTFWMGTALFLGIALVVSITLPFYVASQTRDKSTISTNKW